MTPGVRRDDSAADRLRALPVQLMNTDQGIILVRGVVELRISGERADVIVPEVIAAASDQHGITRRDLLERFAAPDREMVGALLDELRQRFIVVPAPDGGSPPAVESALEVFYWHFGQRVDKSFAELNGKPIVLLGVNTISERIALSLAALNLTRVSVVDFHVLRNLRLYDDGGALRPDAWRGPRPLDYDEWAGALATDGIGCLVATSDFGGPHLMREWNRYCVEHGVHFMPVVLDKFVGTVGPLVIPSETACYECFRLRENANMDAPEIERAAEKGAPERQAVVGFHPAMAGVLGEVAAMELSKVYGGGVPWRPNQIIEIRLLVPHMITRRVLRLPRCPVCSTSLSTSSVYIDKESFVPGHLLNYHEFR